jgi:hypothetical protein
MNVGGGLSHPYGAQIWLRAYHVHLLASLLTIARGTFVAFSSCP